MLVNPWRVEIRKLSNYDIYIYISVVCILSVSETCRNKLLRETKKTFVHSSVFFFRDKFSHGRRNVYFSPTFLPRVIISKWSCIFFLRSISKEYCCVVRGYIPFSVITERLRKSVITNYYPRRNLERGQRKEHNCKELKLWGTV